MKGKRLSAVVGLVLLAGTGGGAAYAFRSQPSDALKALDVKTLTMVDPKGCSVGDQQYYGFSGFPVEGSHPVHVTRVEIVHVPAGFKQEKLVAVSTAETGPSLQPLNSANQQEWVDQGYASMPTHPVADMVLMPGVQKVQWWIALTVRITAPHKQQTGGVRLFYTSGGKHGSQLYHYEVGTNCSK